MGVPLLPILAAAAAAVQQGPAFGSQVTVRGTTYMPQVALYIDQQREPVPGLYRRAALNWRARPLQAGRYPAPAFAARREANVGIRLRIDKSGRLTACALTRPSGVVALDNHACPHLLRNAVFHPALDDSGRRRAETVDARVVYEIVPRIVMPAITPAPAELAVVPSPLAPLSLATVGIGRETRRPTDVDGIVADLTVDAEGAVTACTLATATFDDALDRQICDRLRRDVRFAPARDRRNRAISATYTFWAPWPEAGD